MKVSCYLDSDVSNTFISTTKITDVFEGNLRDTHSLINLHRSIPLAIYETPQLSKIARIDLFAKVYVSFTNKHCRQTKSLEIVSIAHIWMLHAIIHLELHIIMIGDTLAEW